MTENPYQSSAVHASKSPLVTTTGLNTASRLIASICFWASPLVCGVIYTGAKFIFALPRGGHGFEQGGLGFALGVGMIALVCTVNIFGFLLVQLFCPRVSSATATQYYVLSGIAGIVSLLAFQAVTWASRQIVSTSDLFWITFCILGALIASILVNAVILRGGLFGGVIKRN